MTVLWENPECTLSGYFPLPRWRERRGTGKEKPSLQINGNGSIAKEIAENFTSVIHHPQRMFLDNIIIHYNIYAVCGNITAPFYLSIFHGIVWFLEQSFFVFPKFWGQTNPNYDLGISEAVFQQPEKSQRILMPSTFPHNFKLLLSNQPFPWHDLGLFTVLRLRLRISPLYPSPKKVLVLPGSLASPQQLTWPFLFLKFLWLIPTVIQWELIRSLLWAMVLRWKEQRSAQSDYGRGGCSL